jgi:hypothetical protein
MAGWRKGILFWSMKVSAIYYEEIEMAAQHCIARGK